MAKYKIHDFTPGKKFRITQNYGDNVAYYLAVSNGGLKHGHEGVDFATPMGTEIYAPFDGIVVRDGINDRDYGNFEVLWDPIQKIAIWFCHLQDSVVHHNDKFKRGDLICRTNNTGRSSGAHCHINFCETDESGYRLNAGNGSQGFLNLMDPNLVEIVYLDQVEPRIETVTPATPEPSQPVTANQSGGIVMNGQTYYSQAEYNAAMQDRMTFWKERDQAVVERDKAIGQLKDTTNDLNSARIQLTGFKALGFETVDHLTKKLDEYDKSIEGLNTQLVQVKQRNENLASEIQKMEKEDYTAIEMGISALQEFKSLKKDFTAIASAADTKPELTSILDKFDSFRRAAEKAFKQASKEVDHPVTDTQIKQVESSATSFFSKLFGLSGRGVKLNGR